MEYPKILLEYVHKKFSSLQELPFVMESYRLICGNHNSYRNCSILLLSIRHLGISQGPITVMGTCSTICRMAGTYLRAIANV